MHLYGGTHPPVILDIEASAMGSRGFPIEIGYYHSEGHCYCALIQPHADWHYWSLEAQAVHGIEYSRLLQAGKPPLEVALELNQALAGKTVYSDGWVVDYPWFRALYEAAGIDPSFRLSALEMIMSEEQIMIWDQVKARVIRQLGVARHRASADARIVQKTWLETFLLTGHELVS
ncbi:hypothetical protein [Gynuella sp.]|uniref:hypothetical protein n=1 Tax=Gynuella sp. TaxID=2969146 RepID=UPI003D0C38E1